MTHVFHTCKLATNINGGSMSIKYANYKLATNNDVVTNAVQMPDDDNDTTTALYRLHWLLGQTSQKKATVPRKRHIGVRLDACLF